MRPEDCFQLGFLGKTRGLDGTILLHFDADNPAKYYTINACLIEMNGQLVPHFIESIEGDRGKAAVRFEEVKNQDQAKRLAGKKVFLPLDALQDEEEVDYYHHELLGCTVVDAQLGQLGQVARLYDQGPNPLMGMYYEGREVLIPIVDAIITALDVEHKTVQVRLPDGLIDVE